jgi:hypothetical protein
LVTTKASATEPTSSPFSAIPPPTTFPIPTERTVLLDRAGRYWRPLETLGAGDLRVGQVGHVTPRVENQSQMSGIREYSFRENPTR